MHIGMTHGCETTVIDVRVGIFVLGQCGDS
jgi:hypothetical protein